jgi:hypothetical protein
MTPARKQKLGTLIVLGIVIGAVTIGIMFAGMSYFNVLDEHTGIVVGTSVTVTMIFHLVREMMQ